MGSLPSNEVATKPFPLDVANKEIFKIIPEQSYRLNVPFLINKFYFNKKGSKNIIAI